MVTASAPGKLMLMGEHAVVYGFPCIVTAVSERLSVSVEATDDEVITIDAPQVKDTRFVDRAIADICAALSIHHHGMRVRTKSDFSSAYGFGSSSAVIVATMHAVASVYKKPMERKQLFTLAYQTVLNIQGVGSGFDVAAATYGGTLMYVKGGSTCEPLNWKFGEDTCLVVGYSGNKADTPTVVREVAKKREEQSDRVNRIFEAIGTLVVQASEAGGKNDWESVGKFMNFNQEYLRDLGVSTEKLETMIAASKKAGAYGAKLSGAGGGDCMIALVPNDKKLSVEQAIEEVGGKVMHVTNHVEGVT